GSANAPDAIERTARITQGRRCRGPLMQRISDELSFGCAGGSKVEEGAGLRQLRRRPTRDQSIWSRAPLLLNTLVCTAVRRPGPTQASVLESPVVDGPFTDHVALTLCGLPAAIGTTNWKLCADNVLRISSKSQLSFATPAT